MKKIALLTGCFVITSFMISCNLDLYPENGYNEYNVDLGEDDNSDNQYTTREDMKGALDAMYNSIKSDIQERGYEDFLVFTDAAADNAYGGSPATGTTLSIETHTLDGTNTDVVRDWSYYLEQVTNANQIVTYIDSIDDASFAQSERNEWKAEAMIWRSYNWFIMSLLWGDVPLVDQALPAITSDNIDETYPLYYPGRVAQLDVFNKIAADLQWAVQYAPNLSSSDKFVCSKAFGYGLLARVYAEKPIQDYAKVNEYCTDVEGMGLSLVGSFSDLWSWNEAKTDMVARHSSESIFEVPYTKSNGNWVWMMFWRNGIGDNPDDSFSWAKWDTPSRNLTAAYDAEGDTERKNQTIIFDQCGWNYYYPADNYAFMYKTRCNASSIIVMRLAEIYLLHAEALAHLGDMGTAAPYVNLVRERAKISDLPASASGSADAMLNAVLQERRLELAFEGHRWFDLKRYGKAIECVNNVNNPGSAYYDSAKHTVRPIDENGLLLPVPDTEIENNPNLTQNPGY